MWYSRSVLFAVRPIRRRTKNSPMDIHYIRTGKNHAHCSTKSSAHTQTHRKRQHTSTPASARIRTFTLDNQPTEKTTPSEWSLAAQNTHTDIVEVRMNDVWYMNVLQNKTYTHQSHPNEHTENSISLKIEMYLRCSPKTRPADSISCRLRSSGRSPNHTHAIGGSR